MSRRRSSAATLIRQILTGQHVTTGPSSTSKGIDGGLASLISAPIVNAYAPGMRRGESVIGPSGHPLGLGPPQDVIAPPVMAGGKYPTSGRNLNQMARAAIAAQYNPVIGAVESSISRTQSQADKAKHQIRRQGNRAVGDLAFLYGNLGREAGRARRQSNRGYRHEINQTRQSYHELGKETNTDYSTSMGSTAKELQRLGIDPSTALQGAARDQAFLNAQRATERHTTIANERDAKRQFSNLLGQARRDIIATGVASIGQSKSQTQAALASIANNLADNLSKLQMQQAQISGQKAAALASSRMSIAASRQKNRSAVLSNKIKEAQLAKLLGLGTGGTSATPATDAIGKGLDFLQTNSAKIQHPAQLANILQYITGGSGPGQQTAFDKPDYPQIWQHLIKTGKRHGWTQADMNYLQRAVQIALGI